MLILLGKISLIQRLNLVIMVQQLNYHITTHLGLNFQSDAGWKIHIQTAYEKACNCLNISGIFKHIPFVVKL